MFMLHLDLRLESLIVRLPLAQEHFVLFEDAAVTIQKVFFLKSFLGQLDAHVLEVALIGAVLGDVNWQT